MGGRNSDGTWGFDENRPGWEKPLYQLMVDNNVTIFFHGHDHFFAKQELDGVIYQLVPQLSHHNFKRANQAGAYGYMSGKILPNSCHLRVTVYSLEVTVDYVRTYLTTFRIGFQSYELQSKANIGGIQWKFGTGLRIVEEYNPATDTWIRRANMPTGRLHLFTSAVSS